MDKFRRTFPIPVSFADGEEPPSAKWDAVSSQARNGLFLAEEAIGDIWNQSGDPILNPGANPTQNAIWIPNIGRSIGRQQLLNPRVPALSTITKYADTISAVASGVAQVQLKYTPVPAGGSLAGSDFTVNSVTPAGAVNVSDYKTSANAVNANGDFYVTPTGRLITFTPITALNITYKPSIASDVLSTSQWNVVPDPNTDVSSNSNYMGLKLAYKNGTSNAQGYWLYLPPRRPLAASRIIGNSPNTSGNTQVAGGEWFFQSGTAVPAQDANYRYAFPAEIATTINTAVSITQLPSGFLWLVDNISGTIIEGLTYSADVNGVPAGPWVIIVSGPALDAIVQAEPSLLSSNASDNIADYQSRFSIIFPGNSVASAVDAVVGNHGNHTHTGSDSSQAISHANLTGLYGAEDSPPSVNGWQPSGYPFDDHIQYLHRRGYDGTNRDALGNGMAGDLLLLDANTNTISNTHNSHSIDFGTSSIKLGYNAVKAGLVLSGSNFEVDNGGNATISWDGTTSLTTADVVVLNDYFVQETTVGNIFNNAQISSTGSESSAFSVVSMTYPMIHPGASAWVLFQGSATVSFLTGTNPYAEFQFYYFDGNSTTAQVPSTGTIFVQAATSDTTYKLVSWSFAAELASDTHASSGMAIILRMNSLSSGTIEIVGGNATYTTLYAGN